jgi:hypothetical protein
MGDLFDKVKLAIQAQKGFCSTGTTVTPLNITGITSQDTIQYTDCDGNVISIPYGDILNNGGIIPDCVQGGSPITPSVPVKLFVQYGTTECGTPGSNLILLSCDKQTPYVVSRGTISSALTKGDICYITFKDNVVDNGCYEIGDDTVDASVDTIEGEPQSFARNCLNCEQAINVTITECDKGTPFVVDPSTITTPLTKDGVYYLMFNIAQVPDGCYTIGNRTPSQKMDVIVTPPQKYIDCPTCLNSIP